MHRRALILGVAACLALAPMAAAQDANVSGTWTATFTTDGQDHPATLTLKTDGAKATGTIASVQRGETDVSGTIQGKTLTLSFTMQGQNGPMPIAMKGDIDGDTMKGTFDFGQGTGTWTAKRGAQATDAPKKDESSAKPDVSGTWVFAIEIANITATPTVVFKQDGESLTGEYRSQQYGTFPLKGTLKGNAIEFTFEMAIEGNALAVSYAGTVDGDRMKGEMSYGAMADGTFTAQRQKK